MKLKKSVLVLLLSFLFACKPGQKKIVWTHLDEDLNMLHGDVKQVTITYDNPLAKGFYYVLNIDRNGKQRGVHMHLQDIHVKTRYITKHNSSSNAEDFIGYAKRISGSKKYPPSDNETKVDVYKYDDQGRIIKYIKIDRDIANGDSCVYKYNNFGDLIESNEYLGGRPFYKRKNKYDKRHLIIESWEEDEEDLSVEKVLYQYKNFDSMNNWLTRYTKSEDGESSIEIRKITYY